MDYVQKLLATNEQEVFRTHRHFFTIFGSLLKEIIVLVLCIVAFILVRMKVSEPFFFYIGIAVVALLAILSTFRDVLIWKSNEYIVTNRRVIHARGIFSKSILD